MKVGVVALQGAFARHAEVVTQLGVEAIEVRDPESLDDLSHVIIPGGESTTFGILAASTGLDRGLREFASRGGAIWGTCMGMIVLAKSIEGRSGQATLGLLDVEVRRNAFGAQVHSFEDTVQFAPLNRPVNAVFIRAPVVTKAGPNVETLATYQEQTVAVRQGKILGTSFHPELTDETGVHEWFLSF